MLNYIIPPIIIVIATALLIIFLFKKAQKIPEEYLYSQEAIAKQPKRRMSVIMSGIGQFWLKILERIMQRLKLLALKFHNVSDECFRSIHKKREKKRRLQNEMTENEKNKDIELKKNYNDGISKNRTKRFFPSSVRGDKKTDNNNKIIKDKNKLEDVLIRRIAINPKDVEAYERLGDYYLEIGNNEDSIECFKQVLKLSPINYKARLKIKRLEKLLK